MSKKALWILVAASSVVVIGVALFFFLSGGHSLQGSWKIVSTGYDRGDLGRATFKGDKTIQIWVDIPFGPEDFVRVRGHGVWNYESEILNTTLIKAEFEYLGTNAEASKAILGMNEQEKQGFIGLTNYMLSGKTYWEDGSNFSIGEKDEIHYAPVFERE